MALQKLIILPNGAAGDYLRFGRYEWDRDGRRCHVPLALYLSAAQAASAPRHPLAIVAQLHLTDADFDAWVSPASLHAPGATLIGQCYLALRAGAGVLAPAPSMGPLDLSDALDA